MRFRQPTIHSLIVLVALGWLPLAAEAQEGMGHVWPLWRQDLTNLAQRLFRN